MRYLENQLVGMSFRCFALPASLALVAALVAVRAEAFCVNPWVTSDVKVSVGGEMPSTYSMEAFHNSSMFKDLKPKEFCRKLFDIYYDGRRQNWGAFAQGMTLWAHTPQEPRANDSVIELDPVLLLNVHGTGYCGIQSGLLEGIYQSRPGGTPGKPAIEARRWFLAGIVHSVCDANYDGTWHYYDIDLGGYGGDADKDVWSVADVIRDPQGYYGAKTSLRSKYFFNDDGNGKWVEKIDKSKSYAFQDCLMLGHEMAFALRKGESFARFFNAKAAGWSETAPFTKAIDVKQKGYCEIVYEPKPEDLTEEALSTADGKLIVPVRCPYNITSSKVEASGDAAVSMDVGKTWVPLDADGLVKQAINRWDYLLKVDAGKLRKVTTRGMLHPGALPRVGETATKMTVTKMAEYQMLTYIPDWSSEEAFNATAKKTDGLKYKAQKNLSLSGGALQGSGEVTIPIKAPPGCKIVKLAAMVLGGTATQADPGRFLELHLGPAGASKPVERSTDCSPWGTQPDTKVDHWETNVSGAAKFDASDEAEVKVAVKGYGSVRSARICVGYVTKKDLKPSGTLVVTHGFDGKTFKRDIPIADLDKNAVCYPVDGTAKANEFIRMEVK